MRTTKLLNPSTIFKEMLASIEDRRETEKERNRRSSRRWRARQPPDELKQKQRTWERNYRIRLKKGDPEKFRRYCNGHV